MGGLFCYSVCKNGVTGPLRSGDSLVETVVSGSDVVDLRTKLISVIIAFIWTFGITFIYTKKQIKKVPFFSISLRKFPMVKFYQIAQTNKNDE